MTNLNHKTGWELKTFLWTNEEKLPGFEQLLRSWLNVHINFCAQLFPEHSWEYQYTERPHTGFLSNAAVLIGGLALEEWSTDKNSSNGKRYGRNDLWLHLSPPSSGEDFYIEVKHARLSLCSPVTEMDASITQTTEWACNDAKALCPKTGRTAAITFLTLSFEDENTAKLDGKTNELLLHIQAQNRESAQIHGIAAIWLGEKDFQLSRTKRNEHTPGWVNHGVGLILLATRIV